MGRLRLSQNSSNMLVFLIRKAQLLTGSLEVPCANMGCIELFWTIATPTHQHVIYGFQMLPLLTSGEEKDLSVVLWFKFSIRAISSKKGALLPMQNR